MADVSEMEAAKAFVKSYTTGKTSTRKKLLSDLTLAAASKDLPAPVVKLTINTLCSTLFRYNDKGSKFAVEESLEELCSVYGDVAVEALLAALTDSCKYFKNAGTSSSLAKCALTALGWSCILIGCLSKVTGVALQCQGVFLSAIPITMTKFWQAAVRKLQSLWKSKEGLSRDSLSVLISGEASLSSLSMLAVLVETQSKNGGIEKKEQEGILALFNKVVLSGRSKPPQSIIVSSAAIFKHTTHAQFSSLLLPGTLKCLLRNPDELLEAVAFMISALPIDCSQYANDILKNAIGHLGSTQASTRGGALGLVKALSSQSSDSGPVQDMAKQLLTALKGSPSGKLTVAEHRCSVLSAIETLSLCPLSSSGTRDLAASVTEGLVAHIKQEVNTGTAVAAAGVLRVFCPQLAESPPKPLIELLKGALSNKSTSPLLRVAYLHCVLALCQGEDKSLTSTFLPLVVQSLERVTATPSPQPAALEEALVACHVLIKTNHPRGVPSQVWGVVGSHSEQLVSGKVVAAATQNSLDVLVGVAAALFTDQEGSLKEPQQREWLSGVVRAMPLSSWQTQKAAVSCLTKAVEAHPDLAYLLLDILEGTAEKEEYPPRLLTSALLSMATPTHPKREDLAIRTLLISHHSSMASSVWQKVISKLNLDPNDLLSQHTTELVHTVLNGMSDKKEASKRALTTLLKLGSVHIVPKIVEEFCELLDNPDVQLVTMEMMEIMYTPQGHLWHQALFKELQTALVGSVDLSNLKRESKAYSYEDQKWEAELRQEQLRKKREALGGKELDISTMLKQAKLSQKRQEAIENQLAYEEKTRNRLTQLDKQLTHMVVAIETSKGDTLTTQTTKLLAAILSSLKCPLTRGHCRRVWTVLVHSVLRDWSLAQLFAETSLCTLTSLSSTLSPVLSKLLPLVEQHHHTSDPLSHAAHTLTLPLLNVILTKSRGCSHDLKESAVHILCNSVSKFVSSLESDSQALKSFPAAETLRLLSDIISLDDESAKGVKLKKSCVEAFIQLLPAVHTSTLPLLTASLLHTSPLLRTTVLRGLCEVDPTHLPTSPALIVAILIVRHDPVEENRILADKLWDNGGYGNSLAVELMPLLIDHASSPHLHMHTSIAQACSVWLEVHRSKSTQLLDRLKTLYAEKKTTPPPKTDSFGREIFIEYRDPWESRVGLAKAMEPVTKFLETPVALDFLRFIIPDALSEGNPEVQKAIMAATKASIATHGDSLAGDLMAHFDKCLQAVPDTVEADVVRQSIVVFMGTLAQHMDKTNPKVKSVVHLLLSNLDTPSQQVQEAIAGCLPPLATVVKEDADNIIKKLMDKLLESTSFSQRKGSAYGLAGLVKGLGIPTLKTYDIMPTLKEAIKNKKNYRHREGALFAFESLCSMLGRLFEPYVVQLLPDLLTCFGDGNQYVREATDETARTIMTHLSNHGVKLILPSLLKALEEDSWRTKAGSAELLGAMAFCAPKQLSSCLPSIVPKLINVLADSHAKVHQAGWQALKQIGSVIKTPEIQALVPTLLDALADPSNKSQGCLQSLLDTEFVHVIDSPSLALIMPTLKCTLEIRSTDTKKMAAQIIGNMYSLTDKKDLTPYLPDVLPGLKTSLVDPVPEVRSTCAKALGAMVRGMGDDGLSELIPWLQSTLVSESSSVDRSGAAQGLSEVLFARGVEYLAKLMPQFINTCQDVTNPTSVRDGYLMLFVYLPVTFGADFIQFIGDVIPCVLKGLADESEFVRDTSLQTGQTIVNRYADTAVEIFLPELERGLFGDNWRIRCSSVQLLGDLLYKISGLSGKMSTESEEDDNFGTEEARQTLLQILGKERRDRVLAGLYMGRSDVAVLVRQTSLHVWKVVVTNTARTLREILPTLVHLLLSCLASRSHDKRTIAARTLGDLVRKLGERVLPEVIPMLEAGLGSHEPEKRQGVCIGLSEIIQHTSRDNVLSYVESLLPTVRNALCDEDSNVRAAAAKTFDSLHSTVGHRILDEVLAPLLSDLSTPDKCDLALDGLKQVMAVKSSVVLPHIVPQLVQPPVNTKALSLLSSVAGEALHKHLDRIIPALITSMAESPDSAESAEGVVLSVQNEPGPSYLIEQLVKTAADTRLERRAAAMSLIHVLCDKSPADLTEHVPQLIIFTTEALNDPSEEVCQKAWLALEATVKRVNPKELPHYTGYLRKALRTAAANLVGEELHGFKLKGIGPALTILKEGLIGGSPDEKEEAARVLVEVINLTSPTTLSTKVVMLIAGPLIRVLGDRYGWHVKVATLEALVQLVRKVGAAAKSFVPQLQTSYLKALNDPNRPVRVQAVTGLTELLTLSTRVDPVFNELHNGIKKTEDPGLRLTMLQALRGVLGAAGSRMSEKHRPDIMATLVTLQTTALEGHRLEAASCLGLLSSFLPDGQFEQLLTTSILSLDTATDWAILQARATALSITLDVAAERIEGVGLKRQVADAVVALATSDRVPVCVSGLQCLGSFMNKMADESSFVVGALKESMVHSSSDIRVAGCDVCGSLTTPTDPLLSTLLPPVLQCCRDKNTAVKAAAEKAIASLVQGEAHLKHCMGLLEALDGSKLEDSYKKVQAKLAKEF